jgi:streptomycin 6-kinase
MSGEVVEPGLRAFTVRTFGDAGRAWLATLPEIVRELATRWELELGRELPGGLLACVCEATTAAGSRAVLKVGAPWSRSTDEIAALRSWAGRGAPAVLASDERLGALVMERIDPGTHPADADPEALARTLRALHLSPLEGLPPLAEVVRQRVAVALRDGRAHGRKAAWAISTLERLERNAPPPVLLHGDLDERNLLVCDRRGLVAIDPSPCAGDPAYDAGYWVHGNRRRGRRARLGAIVAATGLDRARVRDWAAVVGVHG